MEKYIQELRRIVAEDPQNNMIRKLDPLTGLFNAQKFEEDLNSSLQNAESGCVMILGVDNLKNINNLYGREGGNEVLCAVARALSALKDEKNQIYRLDGDKFAVLAKAFDRQSVEALYEKLQQSVADQCTISSGVAEYESGTGIDANALYQHAENALDRAKKNGKNTQEFFEEKIYEEQLYELDIQEALRSSVNCGYKDFVLHYQPQISADSCKIYGVEALLRYESATHGRISPEVFIPILEQTGMIVDVGEWVLRTAVQQCKEWRKTLPWLRVSVNISYVQLCEEKIVDRVISVLDEYDMPGDVLTLEVTESVRLQDYPVFNKIFYKLAKKGIEIAIDDFGTGYSNFGYLKSMDIDEIKIDRSFVSGIQHSAYNYRLLSNMIELAHSAQIRVCCEGVETEAELQTLKELHPDIMQGYLFAKPYSAEQLAARYIERNDEAYQRKREQEARYRQVGGRMSAQDRDAAEQEKLAAIIDGMDELVYVRDMNNHELFYMNSAGRELTGIYDYRGRKCYEVLQNRKTPCPFCQNHNDRGGSYHVWETLNEHLKKYFLIKDKLIPWEGQIARLTVCLDVTEKEIISQKVQEKLDFEQNIVACTRMLVEESDGKKAINSVVKMIGEFYQADCAYVFELQDNKEFWDNTYEWCAQGVTPQIENLQDVPMSVAQRWVDNFRKGESIIIEDIETIKEISPEEYETLAMQNIKSVIVSPVWRGAEVIAFIGVDNPRRYMKESGQVQAMAYFLADRMRKDMTENRLKELLNLQYEDVLKSTSLGLWFIRYDMDGSRHQMFADQTMQSIMGIKGELAPEECYQHWYTRIQDGYYHYVHYAVEDMIAMRKPVELSYTWNHPEKGEVSVRCLGIRVEDSDGRICLSGYHREINEVDSKKFIPEAGSIIFEYNEKLHSVYFHSERAGIAGDSGKEEDFPQCWLKAGIVHPHFVGRFHDVFTRIKEKPEIMGEEFLLLTKDGTYDWFKLKTKVLSKDDQDADMLIAILDPASQERAAELQQMRRQDFYKASLAEKIAYMEIDMESHHILDAGGLWSVYKEEYVGKDHDYKEILVRSKEYMIHPDDIEAYEAFFDDALHRQMVEEQNYTAKLQYRRMLDGRMQWVEITGHIFQEQFSESLYALVYLKNIDAEKSRALEHETAATRDPLTGIYNRGAFEAEVTKYMITSVDQPSTLMMLDLDNFKRINDTYGHVEGDRVLKQLADVLMTTFRRKDLLGRHGGDEFLIFLKNVTDTEVINRRLDEFRASFAKANQYGSTCSIGITKVEPKGFSYSEVLRRADRALYRSKERGKNTYSYYEGE